MRSYWSKGFKMSNASLKEQLEAMTDYRAKPERQNEKQKEVKKTAHHRANSQTKNHESAKAPYSTKSNWLAYVQYGVLLLRAYFPSCFKVAHQVAPLKKGIKQDLVKRLSTLKDVAVEDKACMVKSLSYYVNRPYYHKSMQAGANRIDLDGNPDGTVSETEAAYSSQKFQLRQKNKQNDAKSSEVKSSES